MDIRQIAAIGAIALVGTGMYRVVKSQRTLVRTAKELDTVLDGNERKLEMLNRIDTLRAARVTPMTQSKSKFDNGKVLEGQAARV